MDTVIISIGGVNQLYIQHPQSPEKHEATASLHVLAFNATFRPPSRPFKSPCVNSSFEIIEKS